MTPLDLARLSTGALLRHKLRSALTLLGIVIGILSVSSISSVIRGIDRYMASLLGGMGSQGFVVTKIGMPSGEEDFLKALKRRDLASDAAQEIKRRCPSVEHVAPFVRAMADVKARRLAATNVTIEGTNEDAQYMSDIGLEAGRYFTPYEVQHASPVCIVGADVSGQVFSDPDPTGSTIYIKGHRFTVIGAQARMGSVLGISRDSFVRIPFTTFEKMFGGGYSADISVRSRGPEVVGLAVEETRGVMRAMRKLGPRDEDDFGILTSKALLEMWRRLSASLFMASIGVGSISLLVGGIGIMNIMFVSVKERTSEIGIRKAIGARRRAILLQFLTESSILCLVGGAIGVAAGVGSAWLLSWKTRIPVAAEWWAIMLSLGVAVGVGLFFGVYPAVKAASLDPVEALRHGQ